MINDVVQIKDQKNGVAGHLYCVVTTEYDADRECDYDSFGHLYWLGSDGELYATSNAVGEKDDEEPSHPDYDYLVEQTGVFNAKYAS